MVGCPGGKKEGERKNEREGCETTELVQEAEGKIHIPTLPQGTKVGRKSRAYDDDLIFYY